MSVPLVEIGRTLVISLPGELPDADVALLETSVLERLKGRRFTGVLIDLTAVDVVDSYLGRTIRDLAALSALMGARTVVTGISPAVAITLVELGLDLPRVRTELNLERGLAWLSRTDRT
ncbi:MAG: STAS domain-containing protein [Clostridia bacterium]|nr:STAS domain-containing protein [Clostridia bacterium]